jgi:dipeptidyl aminopeptidase/acylaminoacyl peptidase
MRYTWALALIIITLITSACAIPGSEFPPQKETASTQVSGVAETFTGQAIPTYTPSAPVTSSPTATPVATETSTPLPSATPTISLTPDPVDPYEVYTIEHLANRAYGGGGELKIEETLAENSYFTRYLFTYPSDGLTIYGFLNMPKEDGSSSRSPAGNTQEMSIGNMPLVIVLHGYIDPLIYDTIDYTTRYADALAREGFLVLHPNLRNYPPSDKGDNFFRVGMAIDVLNLISLVKEQAGKPGPLKLADPDAIGLWGHSMGGGVSTRVMTVSPDVRAVLLYGSMSGDEQKNFERIFSYFSNGERGQDELAVPPDSIQQISPVNYLDRVQAAVSIHHGKADVDVPLAWSLETCRRLRDLDVQVECYAYENQPHTFYGDSDALFISRMIEFFDRVLRED